MRPVCLRGFPPEMQRPACRSARRRMQKYGLAGAAAAAPARLMHTTLIPPPPPPPFSLKQMMEDLEQLKVIENGYKIKVRRWRVYRGLMYYRGSQF